MKGCPYSFTDQAVKPNPYLMAKKDGRTSLLSLKCRSDRFKLVIKKNLNEIAGNYLYN